MVLAEDLIRLQDHEAENDLLHRVSIVPNRTPLDKDITPYCFDFEQTPEFWSLLLYWQARLALINICISLPTPATLATPSDSGSDANSSSHRSTPSSSDESRLIEEQTRNMTNLMTSWQQVSGLGINWIAFFGQALVPFWSAVKLRDADDCLRGLSRTALQQWARRCYQKCPSYHHSSGDGGGSDTGDAATNALDIHSALMPGEATPEDVGATAGIDDIT
jgi:hypothetical protein